MVAAAVGLPVKARRLRPTPPASMITSVPRDAVLIPALPPGARRIEARESRIWIRVAGRWLPGHVQCWRRLPDGRLAAWLSFQADPAHPTVAPVWGLYVYDPEAIVDRGAYPEPPGS